MPNYYHGSPILIDKSKDGCRYLETKFSKILGGQKAVFATNSKEMAILFIPKWTDADIDFGTSNGVFYCMEQYPGAFKLLKKSGYLYEVPTKPFKSDNRLGIKKHEFISKDKVKIAKYTKIKNAYKELEKSKDVVFISFKAKNEFVRQYIEESKK
jgi:hypothetical protein